MWQKDLERGMIIGTGIMIVNLVIGFIATVVLVAPMTASVAGGLAFLEMGISLILGGCMMSRQPLNDEDRQNDDGTPTSSWRIALLGRQIIFAGVFLFIYAGLITIISLFYPI